MQVLFEGIYSKFTGSTGAGSLYALLGGRLHLGEAPQGSAYPYGVYHLISDVPEYVFDTTTVIEHTLIQFNLYDDDKSATDINAAFTALAALYDHSNITVTGYSSVIMEREFSNLSRGETLWDYFVQYRLIIQKN